MHVLAVSFEYRGAFDEQVTPQFLGNDQVIIHGQHIHLSYRHKIHAINLDT